MRGRAGVLLVGIGVSFTAFALGWLWIIPVVAVMFIFAAVASL